MREPEYLTDEEYAERFRVMGEKSNPLVTCECGRVVGVKVHPNSELGREIANDDKFPQRVVLGEGEFWFEGDESRGNAVIMRRDQIEWPFDSATAPGRYRLVLERCKP